MVSVIFIAITAFLACLLTLPFIIRYSAKNNLYDAPDKRRIHTQITPSMGGIAIFAGLAIGILAWTKATTFAQTTALLAVLIIPFLIGFLDDLIHLRPLKKILGQALAAILVFFLLDIKITSLDGLFGVYELHPAISFALTFVTIILLTNSFNLIDGIDGLAGTFSLVALLFFGTWFYAVHIEHYALFCFTLVGSILAFLTQNWQPSKIFMGDTGSLVIGMTLSILAIAFMSHNAALPVGSEFKFMSTAGTALCVLIVPIVDTIRVVCIRLYLRLSPLTADKRHIHHAVVRLGKSHRLAVLLLMTIHISFIALAVVFRHYGNLAVIGIASFIALTLCVVLDRLIYFYGTNKKAEEGTTLKRKVVTHF